MGAAWNAQTGVIDRLNIIIFNGRRSAPASHLNPAKLILRQFRPIKAALAVASPPCHRDHPPFLCLFYLFTSVPLLPRVRTRPSLSYSRCRRTQTTRDTPLTLIPLPSSPASRICGRVSSIPATTICRFPLSRRVAGEYSEPFRSKL